MRNDKYIKILKNNFPKNFSLNGMKIAIDCANGAGYKSGPKLFKGLGAKVYQFGTSPNGLILIIIVAQLFQIK